MINNEEAALTWEALNKVFFSARRTLTYELFTKFQEIQAYLAQEAFGKEEDK